MNKENSRCIVNDVILVGRLRTANDTSQIDTNLATEEQIAATLKKFRFTLESEPSEAARTAGVKSNPYFHVRTMAMGGESYTAANGRKVKLSSKTGKYGWTNIFENNRKIHFDEIKQELLAKRIELIGGDPNNGTVRLKEYGIVGFFDEFPAGFFFKVMTINRTTGKNEQLIVTKRRDDGTYVKEQAISNTIRHFVFEDEEPNLDSIRENLRAQMRKYKIEVQDNTTDPDRSVEPTTTPTVIVPEEDDTP